MTNSGLSKEELLRWKKRHESDISYFESRILEASSLKKELRDTKKSLTEIKNALKKIK